MALLNVFQAENQKLTWVANVLEIKRTFAKKLNLLKRSRFLPRGILKDFYFKVIVPAVKYGLVLWGSCCKSDLLNSIERLHCRAARIIYNLPKDMASDEVLRRVQWPTFFLYNKLDVLRLFFIRLIVRLYQIRCPRLFVKTALTLISLESRTVSSYQGANQDI